MTFPGEQENPTFSVEQSLVAIRNGHHSETGSLLQFYENYLLKIANEQLSQDLSAKVGASDLVQSALTEAFCHFKSFRGSGDKELKTWLRTILLNRITDTRRHFVIAQMRSLSREVALPGHEGAAKSLLTAPEHSLTPSQPLVAAEELQLFRNAMSQLDEDSREIIRLRSFEKLGFKEIGELMGRSHEAVRKQWRRAVEKLGQELDKIDPKFNERF